MDTTLDSPVEVSQAKPRAIRGHLRKLDRRQWWLWSTTILVLVLLTVGVASFQFPAILSAEQYTYSFYLNQSIRALVGLVLVFCVYLVYQQLQIIRMRNLIADQIESLAKVETLTTETYKLAALDHLTGLYNRRSGEQRLSEEMSRACRHGRPLTLLMLDVDGLKQINDSLGHVAGDELLKSFADHMQRAIRGSDLAVRMGGDEFMVVLPECPLEEVTHVMGRLNGLDIRFGSETIRCHFSSGWADFKPGETLQEFLHRADEALYANKRSGKELNGEVERSHAAQPLI